MMVIIFYPKMLTGGIQFQPLPILQLMCLCKDLSDFGLSFSAHGEG